MLNTLDRKSAICNVTQTVYGNQPGNTG